MQADSEVTLLVLISTLYRDQATRYSIITDRTLCNLTEIHDMLTSTSSKPASLQRAIPLKGICVRAGSAGRQSLLCRARCEGGRLIAYQIAGTRKTGCVFPWTALLALSQAGHER